MIRKKIIIRRGLTSRDRTRSALRGGRVTGTIIEQLTHDDEVCRNRPVEYIQLILASRISPVSDFGTHLIS